MHSSIKYIRSGACAYVCVHIDIYLYIICACAIDTFARTRKLGDEICLWINEELSKLS